MSDNEKIADIVADLRQEASDCPDIERAGIYDRYADRFEAALKREADSIHRAMVLIAGIEMESPEDPPRLWTALEDAYDALSDALGTDGDTTVDEEEAKATGRHFVVKPSGNPAAMREALESILNLAYEVKDANADGGWRTTIPTEFVIATIKNALAAPPRNCDVGTAEEQTARYDKFCYTNRTVEKCCTDCPALGVADCEFVWAQMSYEEGENNEAEC